MVQTKKKSKKKKKSDKKKKDKEGRDIKGDPMTMKVGIHYEDTFKFFELMLNNIIKGPREEIGKDHQDAKPLISKEGKNKNKIQSIYNSIDYSLLNRKHFLVKDISALKNIRLEESIRWLYNTIMDDDKIDSNNVNYANLV